MITDNIYIFGGHALSVNYHELLTAAKASGEITSREIFCIDDNPTCVAASTIPQAHICLHPAEFIAKYINRHYEQHPLDAIVPDHTAQHVLLKVFLDKVAAQGTFKTQLIPLKEGPNTPFLHKAENQAIWAISYATWICPPDCQEPAICPHTKAPRSWDCGDVLKPSQTNSNNKVVTHLFACAPLYQHIVQIPGAVICQEMMTFEKSLTENPPERVIIGTHSHCHGIIGHFAIEPKTLTQ